MWIRQTNFYSFSLRTKKEKDKMKDREEERNKERREVGKEGEIG